MERIFTGGDLEVQNIKVGDTIYEFEYGCGIESQVLTEPEYNEESKCWEWESLNILTNKVIDYKINPKYSHYAPKLYSNKAYNVKY